LKREATIGGVEMLLLLAIPLGLAVVGVILTIRLIYRDGYQRIPDRFDGEQRS
jgi:hypothetical protein